MNIKPLGLKILATIVFSMALLMQPLLNKAHAQIGEWQDLGGGKARMVSVVDPNSNQLHGAIEVQLKPGWTTYWRNPGESGIPPQFDFSKSRGIQVSVPEFPAPKAKMTSGILSYVYEKRVLFPFEGAFSGHIASSTLELDLLIGVCEAVCIPAVASFKTKFAKSGSNPEAMHIVQEAHLALPLPSQDGKVPAIQSAKISSSGELEVTIKGTTKPADALLLTEGHPGWYFLPGKLLDQLDDISIFSIGLQDLPKGIKLRSEKLRFTLVTDSGSVEAELIIN